MCQHLSEQQQQQQNTAAAGIRLGATSLGLLFASQAVTLPYQQARRDAMGCTAQCLGRLNSARSTLKLVGAVVIGKVSDSSVLQPYGGTRRLLLMLGLVVTAFELQWEKAATSVTDLWYSMLPCALEQNMTILKALMTVYLPIEATAGERASVAGSLGFAIGMATMTGPLIGSRVVKSYNQATMIAWSLLVLAAVCVKALPTPQPVKVPPPSRPLSRHFLSFLDVPSARSPAAILLLFCRLLSTVSFHIYRTILTPSLRDRFAFGPKEYGTFFSVIGLFFTLSQGFLAKTLLDRFGQTPRNRTRLVVSCTFLIAVCRYFAFESHTLWLVYLLFGLMVVAYGVTSTVFAADTSQIADPSELGAFFGLVATVESTAGMAGPLLASALSQWHPTAAPLWSTVVLSGACTVILGLAYESIVLGHIRKMTKQE